MDEKIKILLEQIKWTDEDLLKNFQTAVLKNVIVHQKDESWSFVIEFDENLDCDFYLQLEQKMNEGFASIKKTRLEIVPRKEDTSKIPSYFEATLEKVTPLLSVAMNFKDSLVEKDGQYQIEVRNQAEYHQVNSI